MKQVVLDYVPTPKQALLHNSKARQILYGGTVAGGKSKALRWDAVQWCLSVPGIECYLFRKTFSELENTHIRPLLRELPSSVAVFNSSKGLFRFQNGSKIVLAHCTDPQDHLKYLSTEMHVLLIDEAALFHPHQIIELRARVRLGDFAKRIPPQYREYLPRMVLASNPGGPAHSLLKRTFIDPAPPYTVFNDAAMQIDDSPGWTTVFLPAFLKDNPHIEKDYGVALHAMAPERRKAMLEGDWDAAEGLALHSLHRQRHCVRTFPIPDHWTRFMSLDWGVAAPFSVGWYCVVGETTVVKENLHLEPTAANPERAVFLTPGAVVRYDELYGWTGKENEGLRLDSAAVAKLILDREKENKIKPLGISYRVADYAMWAQHDGPSPAEKMMVSTGGKLILYKSKKDRIANYNEILSRLAGNPFVQKDGKVHDDPMLFIADKCVQAWRTLPTLLLDKLHPDKGPGENQEDHVYDELSYALASRPMVTTAQEVSYNEWERAKALVKELNVDAYSTR